MKTTSNTPNALAGIQTLDEIDSLLESLSHLARTEASADTFYAQLLETATVAIGAKAAAIWSPAPVRILAPLRQVRIESAYSVPFHRVSARESDRYRAVLANDRPASYAAEPSLGFACVVLACPLRDSTGTRGVLTLYLPAETPAVASEQLLEFVQAVAAIALEFELYRQVAGVEEAVRLARQVESFSLRVHQPWNPTDAAYEIANEGRRLIGCDRVTVLIRRGRSWQVVAVSGVDRIAKRSGELRRLQALVASVARLRQPLIYRGESGELAPQIEAALAQYLENAPSRDLVIAPAAPPESGESSPAAAPQMAIVAEQFTGRLLLEWIPRIEMVAEHAAVAISRARALNRIPGLFRGSPGSWASSVPLSLRGALFLLLVSTIVAAGLALAYVQTDFRVVAHGRMQPVVRQWVFAPADGVVEQLAVDHGELVEQGGPLLALRSSDLELNIEQVEGQLETARQELATIDMAHLQHAAVNASSDVEASDLISKHLTVEDRIRNLQSQLQILQAKKAALVVTSPIAGTVLNWQPAQYLRGRPIERGTALLEIGNLAGKWVVELDVTDRNAGHVLRARESGEEKTPVSFVVATNPANVYQGTVADAANSTHLDENGQSAVRIDVAVNERQIEELRHGAAVIAKIDCGQRSVGYVWFHELMEEIARRFF